MTAKRLVIDTNLWISFLITNNLSFIEDYILKSRIRLILSVELLEEFIDVVSRNKFRKYFGREDIEVVLHFMDEHGDLINVVSDLDLCRDKKDNFLLNLSVDGKADYLVTGDNDLLELSLIEDTQILKISDLKIELKNLNWE